MLTTGITFTKGNLRKALYFFIRALHFSLKTSEVLEKNVEVLWKNEGILLPRNYFKFPLGIIHRSRDGGGEGFWSKRHETVTRGGVGSKIFWNPQSAILTFSHSFFYDLPMNLVAFVQDFQNRIRFIAQGIYP